MTTYMYIGAEQYFVPVVSPKVEVNQWDTIKLTDEQAKNIDKRFFVQVSDEGIDYVEKQINDLQDVIDNVEKEKQQLIDEITIKHKQEIEALTSHKSEYAKSLNVQLDRLVDIKKLVQSKTKKEEPKEEIVKKKWRPAK